MGRKSFFRKGIKNFRNLDFCFKLPAFFAENDHGFRKFTRNYTDYFGLRGHRDHRDHRELAGLVFLAGFACKVNFATNTCLRQPGSLELPTY